MQPNMAIFPLSIVALLLVAGLVVAGVVLLVVLLRRGSLGWTLALAGGAFVVAVLVAWGTYLGTARRKEAVVHQDRARRAAVVARSRTRMQHVPGRPNDTASAAPDAT